MSTTPVNTEALRQVLIALNAPGHYIRELQATRRIASLTGTPNPIDVLVEDYERSLAQEQPVQPSEPVGYVSALGLRLFIGSATDHTIRIRHTPIEGDVPVFSGEPVTQAKPEQVARPFDQIGADRLAAAVARLVSNRSIDARSEAADALLDYIDVGGVGGPSDVPAWLTQYEKRRATAAPTAGDPT